MSIDDWQLPPARGLRPLLDQVNRLAIVQADAQTVLAHERPLLVDEGQLHPPV